MSALKLEKERFIELRAQGMSFDKIALELNLSKQTLIKWQKELEKEISNLEYLHHQSLIEQFKLTRKSKVEMLLRNLEKVWVEIESRDLKEASLKDLLYFKADLESKLSAELDKVKYFTGEREPNNNFVLESLCAKEITLSFD